MCVKQQNMNILAAEGEEDQRTVFKVGGGGLTTARRCGVTVGARDI